MPIYAMHCRSIFITRQHKMRQDSLFLFLFHANKTFLQINIQVVEVCPIILT